MRVLFNHIKNHLTTNLISNGQPVYKTIEYFRGQPEDLEQRRQEIVMFPAVFIEFVVNDVRSLSLGIKDMDLIVRFHFMFENYTGTRLPDMDMKDQFDAAVERLRGNEADKVQFTSFEEAIRTDDIDIDMVNNPIIDYRTVYRNINAYQRKNNKLVKPVTPTTTGEIQ